MKKMGWKKIGLLILASFFATTAVYRFVKRGIIGGQDAKELPKEVTFTEHISPILHQHCTQCHRPNGSASFQLITYDNVIRKKKPIRKMIEKRIEPTSQTNAECMHFDGKNVLADYEKQLIYKWMDDGYKEGDIDKLAILPTY